MVATRFRNAILPALARSTRRPAKVAEDRVLIFQPDHLGDILLSEPAVRYLRQALPDAELVGVVGPWSAEIARMAWPVDRIERVTFPAFSRAPKDTSPIAPYRQLQDDARRLCAISGTDAVVLRDDAWWAAWLARASVAGSVATGSDQRAAAFATTTPVGPPPVHRTAIAAQVVVTYLAARGIELVPDIWDMSPRLAVQPHLQADPYQRTDPYVVIHPGSGAPVKSWPVRSWRAVVNALNIDVVLTGSGGERATCEAIADGFEHVSVAAGTTSLSELSQLLAGAVAAIGTDNGPMHLAGALKTPTVRLFGPSNPERYGPWPGTPGQTVVSAGWSCPRCEDLSVARPPVCGCMAAISVDSVLRTIRQVFGDAA